jgi:hypothetical protein
MWMASCQTQVWKVLFSGILALICVILPCIAIVSLLIADGVELQRDSGDEKARIIEHFMVIFVFCFVWMLSIIARIIAERKRFSKKEIGDRKKDIFFD